MIRQLTAPFSALFGVLLLTACVNLKPTPSQTTSFTLGPVDMEAQDAPLAEGEAFYVMRPQIPTYLDASRLGFRRASGEVGTIAGTRWAEPLTEGIARTIALYLMEKRPEMVGRYYPWPNTDPDATRLSIELQRFGGNESGQVQLVGTWSIRQAGKQRASGRFVSEVLAWEVGEPESLVAAYNQALQALAHAIGKSLGRSESI